MVETSKAPEAPGAPAAPGAPEAGGTPGAPGTPPIGHSGEPPVATPAVTVPAEQQAVYRGGTRLRQQFPTVLYLRKKARTHVPSFAFEYGDGGAGADGGIARNWAALDAVQLVPRIGLTPVLPPI